MNLLFFLIPPCLVPFCWKNSKMSTYICMCFLFNSVVYINIYVSSKVDSILLDYKRKKIDSPILLVVSGSN